MKKELADYIKAGYPGLFIVSPEEKRVEAHLTEIANELQFGMCAWSATTGLINVRSGAVVDTATEPVSLLENALEGQGKRIILLRDFHMYMEDADVLIIRAFKDALTFGKRKNQPIVVLGCRQTLPPELEKEFTVVEYTLPTKDELSTVLTQLATVTKTDESHMSPEAIAAAAGMTTHEAENAYALSLVKDKTFKPETIAAEKAQAVRKSGILEIVETEESLASIGGQAEIKSWMTKRSGAFSDAAKAYGLPTPKGMLIVGISGTGKSLAAKAVSSVLRRPLLRLDVGKVFAGIVGQSEANLRDAIATAEAIAPCVLWVDEIEKSFAGSKSSGQTDGGTSSRVFGSFLTWLQDKKSPVFVVATANDVSQLPPEMLRKGRFDEMFFVDLPDLKARTEIWEIQIKKYGRDPAVFACSGLAVHSNGYTGAEIEQAVIEALYNSFESGNEPEDCDFMFALESMTPLSQTMAEELQGLKTWAKGRARPADVPVEEPDTERSVVH